MATITLKPGDAGKVKKTVDCGSSDNKTTVTDFLTANAIPYSSGSNYLIVISMYTTQVNYVRGFLTTMGLDYEPDPVIVKAVYALPLCGAGLTCGQAAIKCGTMYIVS